MSADQPKETAKSQPATETAKDAGPDDKALGDQELDMVTGGITGFVKAKQFTMQNVKENL